MGNLGRICEGLAETWAEKEAKCQTSLSVKIALVLVMTPGFCRWSKSMLETKTFVECTDPTLFSSNVPLRQA